MPRLWRLAACAAAAVGVAAFLATQPDDRVPAAVASTKPADGAALARAPTEIELSFTAPVDADLSHVSVRDGSGSALNAGRARLVVPERLSQPVIMSAAGEVTVVYHVTFVDGAELAGTLRFTAESGNAAGPVAAVGQSSNDTHASDGVPAPGHRHGVDPISAALLVVDGMVALAAVVLLIRRPRPRPS